MAESARVTSIEALTEFRPALIRFGEEAQAALVSVGSNAAMLVETLRRERLAHWKREIRIRSEEAVRANTKLIQQTASESPRPSVDARKAYEAAKRRVKEAEEKYEHTQQSIRALEKEIEQYRTAIQPMASIVRAGMPTAVARIDRSVAALDAYTAAEHRPEEPGKPAQTDGSEPTE